MTLTKSMVSIRVISKCLPLCKSQSIPTLGKLEKSLEQSQVNNPTHVVSNVSFSEGPASTARLLLDYAATNLTGPRPVNVEETTTRKAHLNKTVNKCEYDVSRKGGKTTAR